MNIIKTDIERFLDKAEITPTCWLWKGVLSSGSYGTFKPTGSKSEGAHRISYKIFVGDIQKGLMVEHSCNNKHCVNPNHLKLVSHKDKKQRQIKLSEKDRFFQKVEKTNGCWLWRGKKLSKGYGRFNLSRTGKDVLAHRYSYKFFKKEDPKNLQVMHTCDNPSCVNPEHLKLGTNNDNVQDMVNKNRNRKGWNHHLRKFNEKQSREIINLINEGWTQKQIADKMMCSQSCIAKIKKQKYQLGLVNDNHC